MVYVLIIVLMAVAVTFLAARLLVIKSQIKSVCGQLDINGIRMAHIELADNDLEILVKKINRMIDETARIQSDYLKNQESFKQSMADISHDIRTPLTAAIGYLQISLKDCQNEKVRENILIALERAQRCNSLVNDFFEISVIDSHELCPVMEKIDISGVICEQILANYNNFNKNGIIPQFDNADIPVYAYADSNMLSRIIQNLISNSLKYADGNITFEVTTCEMVEVRVSNPTKENYIDVEHIFDRLYRQDTAHSLSSTGLGLYICRKLAETMDGNIKAEFENNTLHIILSLQW